MKRGLYKPDADGISRVGTVEHRLHEAAAEALILDVGIDGDGTYAMDDGALVEAVGAENLSVGFSDHTVEAGRVEHAVDETVGVFGIGKIAGKVVGGVDGREGVVADLAAGSSVFRSGLADDDVVIGRHLGNDLVKREV